MKTRGVRPWLTGLALLAGALGWGVGCGQSPAPAPGEVDYILEAAKEPHVIGHDSTGFPVYGVDEEGKPIYWKEYSRKRKED